MAFLTGKLQLTVYTDSAQTDFPQELFPGITKQFTDLSITGCESLLFNLAASGSQTINLNSLTSITGFYLFSDATDLSLQINGAAAISYKATYPGFMPLVVTSLIVTNASSTTATNVTLILIKG